MTDAVAEAGDAIVADHIATAGKLDAFALVITACAHDGRVPLAYASDCVVLDAGVHHARLVGLDAELRVDDATPHHAVLRVIQAHRTINRDAF